LFSYFPQVQELDATYKLQHGIVAETYHAEDDSHVEDESHSEESDTHAEDDTHDTDEIAIPEGDIVTVNAIVQQYDWVPELGLALSFYLDGLSLLFGLIITGI